MTPKEEPKNICIQTGLPCGMQCLSEDICNRTKPKQRLEKYSERFDNDKSAIGNPETLGKRMVEEPKQESFVERMKPLQEQWQQDMYKELMKQETLEEYIERETKGLIEHSLKAAAKAFIRYGAKWQQERSYSEEDMKSAFKVGFSIGYGSDVHAIDEKNRTCEEWFKQYKKK